MSPMPNQTMNSGSRPSSGIDRGALSTGSKAYSPIRLRPLATASSTAIATPTQSPMPHRSAETSSDAWSVP